MLVIYLSYIHSALVPSTSHVIISFAWWSSEYKRA